MLNRLVHLVFTALFLLTTVTAGAGTSQGTVAWDIAELEDNAGQRVVGVVLDYRFDTEKESIPVNGYLVLEIPDVGTLPVPIHGTVLVFGDGSMAMYLNDLFNAYVIEIAANLNGLMVMYDATGSQVDFGAATYKPVFQSVLTGKVYQ